MPSVTETHSCEQSARFSTILWAAACPSAYEAKVPLLTELIVKCRLLADRITRQIRGEGCDADDWRRQMGWIPVG